jgi:hypothetical protein
MRKSAITVVLVSAFLIAAASWAKEGSQRIVGTVESRTGQQLKVRTPEGRVISIGLSKGTRYRKGSGAAALSDVKAGARVVVEAQRTGSRWVARSVRIEGPSHAASTRPAPQSQSHAGMHGEHAAGATGAPAEHAAHEAAPAAAHAMEAPTPTERAGHAEAAPAGAAAGQPAPADHAGHAETPPTGEDQPQHAGMAPGEPMQHGGMTPGQPMPHGAMAPGQPMEHGRNLFQSDMTVMAGMTPRDPMAGMAMPHWQLMTMGAVRLLYDHQGGPSGDDAFESSNFGMLMTQRDVAGGRVTLMMMSSLEPATIPDGGSPQLFQTGETFHGNPIVDRQHAHDLFMNLSATYRGSLGTETAYWVQAAVRGEPALGPTAFMHRASAGENPTATLGHHWQDSTHITNNVITVGAGWRWLSLEGSAFHGAEPDEQRWDIEGGGLDSISGRVRADLGRGWSSQVSYGFLKHPEALQPGDLRRTTASLHYGAAGDRPLAVTLLWGRNREEHGTTDSFLGEAAYQITQLDQVYGRVERVEKPRELLLMKSLDIASNGGAEAVVPVRALTVGYFRDLKIFETIRAGLGADLTAYGVPSDLRDVYGQFPVSVHVFARLRWNKGHGGTHGGH